MPSTNYVRSRWLLAIFCLLAAGVLVTLTGYSWFTTSISEGIKEASFNDILNNSVMIRMGLASSLFQITVIVAGALWGVVIAKEDESVIVFSDTQEMIMFVCASVLLLTSLFSHIVYSYRVSYIYNIAGENYHKDNPMIGDVFHPFINNFFVYQMWHFGVGCFLVLTTLWSAHKLK